MLLQLAAPVNGNQFPGAYIPFSMEQSPGKENETISWFMYQKVIWQKKLQLNIFICNLKIKINPKKELEQNQLKSIHRETLECSLSVSHLNVHNLPNMHLSFHQLNDILSTNHFGWYFSCTPSPKNEKWFCILSFPIWLFITISKIENLLYMVPQIGHGHSEQGIYTGIRVHHAFVFVHQEHEHQSKEPVLYLPINTSWETS